ncbi:MAG: c-type cytochrome [Pseudomonadota bacterium]
MHPTHYLKLFTRLAGVLLLATQVQADNLGFDGKIVEPDCDAMGPWFNCRKIDSAPEAAKRGYEYIHHTSKTLGPDGNKKFSDGTPYSTSNIACSSCHFTGGHVPSGTPMYQSPAKYAGLPYFRPLNYNRDLEDSIVDCFRNCMNTSRTLSKSDPVMQDMVAYIHWLSEGVTDPNMQGTGWVNLPGTALPAVDANVANMVANPAKGKTLYRDKCSSCHSKDGAGKGEYRRGENRPRTPALWGDHSYSRGAAFYNSQNLAGYIRTHMPYGKPNTLSAQQALDMAAYINDQARPDGMADEMFCHIEADGIPGALRKPAAWLVGCSYTGEPFSDAQILYGPWQPITDWRNAEITRLKALQP